MKKIFLILSLLVLTMWQVQAQQTIHWLLFIDTEDERVGDMDKNARDWLKQHFVDPVNAVLVDAGVRTDIQLYDGSRLSPQNCKNAIQNLNCKSNDIVFFYYIGHGGRSAQENDREHPWPKMWMGQDNPNMMLDLGWVHNQLKSKNPQLLITVGMCCNVKQNLPLARTPQFSPTYGRGCVHFSEDNIITIKKLFLEHYGDLLATSASPGQSSIGVPLRPPMPESMDLYTAVFTLLFEEEMSNTELTWDKFFEEVGKGVDEVSAAVQRHTPIFKSSLTMQRRNNNGNNNGGTPPPPPPTPPTSINNNDVLNSIEIILDNIVATQDEPDGISALFTSDAIVKVVGEDGTTIVDRIIWDDYLLRITTNNLLIKTTPVRFKMAGQKISELYVMEYYRQRR